MTERVGTFGGTFDPVHNGHLALARAALDTVGLDRLLFVPAARPPHKKEGSEASFTDRTRMISLAIASETRLGQSTVEAEREGPSYTVETLRTLAQELGPGVEIHLVVGADSVWELGTWYEAGEIFRMARFVVAPRPGWELPGPDDSLPGLTGEQIEALRRAPVLPVQWDVSSREIRRRVREGLGIADLVPAEVEAYIREKGLYRS
jgi:nicotinate-nucleotide adenylyltransferase